MFSLICAWINGWVNNREAADLRRQRTHYDVTLMCLVDFIVVVVVVTLFPTKIHENIHMYNTFTVVSPQNVRMYFVSGCQKKPRLIELAAATCYLQFCRATARPGPEEMTHWHPGGRFKESFSSNGFHYIYSIILSRIISRYVPFHQMSFWWYITFIRNKILVYIIPQFRSFDPYSSMAESKSGGWYI